MYDIVNRKHSIMSSHFLKAKSFGASNVKPKVLIGCSGSVASLKVPELVAELSQHFQVMVIATQNSHFFLEKSELYNADAWQRFESVGGWDVVLYDSDEWEMWTKIGHTVLHIELRRWADIFLIAPASANLIAKACVGIADNLLLSVMRAWDFAKPCVLCPAMNTVMWDHPVTNQSLATLASWGWDVLGPIEKLLACNEHGNGALAPVSVIVQHLLDLNVSVHSEVNLNASDFNSIITENGDLDDASFLDNSYYSADSSGYNSPGKYNVYSNTDNTEQVIATSAFDKDSPLQHENNLSSAAINDSLLTAKSAGTSAVVVHDSTAWSISKWLLCSIGFGVGFGIASIAAMKYLGISYKLRYTVN